MAYTLPKYMMWQGQRVEVIGTGHFPSTILIRPGYAKSLLEVERKELDYESDQSLTSSVLSDSAS